MSPVILDLSTVLDPRTVRIVSQLHPNGKEYLLRSTNDLALSELHRIGVIQDRLAEFAKLGDDAAPGQEATPAQEARFKKLLGEGVKLALPTLEPKVLARLGSSKRAAIIQAWGADGVISS